jgi:translocation and assembly module TamB
MIARRRRERLLGPDLGAWLARVLLLVLAVVGMAAVALPFLFRHPAVRARIEHAATEAIRAETGLDVKLHIAGAVWPPGIVVRDVEVASTDPKRPFARVGEARVTVRPFALLSGEVVIDAIELDQVEVDAELVDGKPTNLPLKLKEHPPKPKTVAVDPPFRVLAVTGANVKVSSRAGESTRAAQLDLEGIDFDVDVTGEAAFDFGVRLHKAHGFAHVPRTAVSPPPRADRYVAPNEASLARKLKAEGKPGDWLPPPGKPTGARFWDHGVDLTDERFVEPPLGREVWDDDAICSVSAALDVIDAPAATLIALHRFSIDVRLDAARGGDAFDPATSCVGTTDPSRVAAAQLDRIDVEIPKALVDGKPAPPPIVKLAPGAARVRVQAPAQLAARYVKLPAMSGVAALDLSPIATIDLRDPLAGVQQASLSGKIDARGVVVEQFRFGESIVGDVTLRPGLVVGSKHLDVKYGDGEVAITDFELETARACDKKKPPMRANVAVKGMSFPGLMRELGVSKASHVRWDFDDVGIKVAGCLDPLSLDGDLVAKTKDFELAQAPVEGKNPGHVIGLARGGGHAPAELRAQIRVRPEALVFDQVRARFLHTSLVGRVSLGFASDLEVDAESDSLDISDVSPVAQIKMAGVAKFKYHVRGKFADPVGEGQASIENFVFDVFPLGNVETATAHVRGTAFEFEQVKARYKDSAYEVPSLRVDLGPAHGAVIDALVTSQNFELGDLYEILDLDKDPRFADIRGHVAPDVRAHFVVGGREDVCGGGRLDLDVKGKILALDLYGERYDGGNADVSVTWLDRSAGGLGMDMDVRGATLHKKGGGTIVASGRVDRGGNLHVRATVGGLQIASLAAMPSTNFPIEGTIDAVADVSGTIDTMLVDADVHLSPLAANGRRTPSSRLHVVRRPLPGMADSPQPDDRGCYRGKKLPPFDLARFMSDPVQGEYALSGELFDGQIQLVDLRVTDQKKKVAYGQVRARNVELGPISALRMTPIGAELEPGYVEPPPPPVVEGKLSADVTLVRYPIDKWWESTGSIEGLSADVTWGDVGVKTVETPKITFSPDGASIPETSLDVKFGDASTKLVLAADVAKAEGSSPRLHARLELPLLPLKKLEDFVPRIERADGYARAQIAVDGTIDAPTWSGFVELDKGSFTLRGFSMPISDMSGRIDLDPKRGVVAKLHGEVGGGTIDVTGGAELRGFSLGDADFRVGAKDVHLRYGDAMSMSATADLHATWSPPEPGELSQPARLEGTVDVDSFLYSKPVKIFDVNAVESAKRTEVEVYDPTKDSVAFDIALRAKSPLAIKNNLVDMGVSIGPQGLRVVGTNQKFGLAGSVNVVSGGLFRFRNSDFKITEGSLRFDDPSKIDPVIDVLARTDFRRASAQTSTSAEFLIRLHAYGTANDLHLDLTSEPQLAQEDVLALLTFGMTRAEMAQVGLGTSFAGGGIDIVAETTGVNQQLKQAIPVIDDFRFGTAYSLRTNRTEPQVTLGKRLTNSVRASVTSGISEQREVIANVEWQLSQHTSVRASYDNVNTITSANVGVDLRFRFEF